MAIPLFRNFRNMPGWVKILNKLARIFVASCIFVAIRDSLKFREIQGAEIRLPVMSEEIHRVNTTSGLLYFRWGSSSVQNGFIRFLRDEEWKKKIVCVEESHHDMGIMLEGSSESFNMNQAIENTQEMSALEFFHIVSSPIGRCRKLYRMGGSLQCRTFPNTIPRMDGQKYVCLDPELQVITGSPNTQDCFVLSFGVNWDISFDVAVREANCEVLMFDPDPYYHPITSEDDHVKFFSVGIDPVERAEYIISLNRTRHFNTFENLAIAHGFQTKLVNILKIDIDGEEWRLLKDMVSKPFLDTVGQVAIEVHGMEAKMMPKDKKHRLQTIDYIREIFKMFEDRGFRKVSYFQNTNSPKTSVRERKLEFYAAGELLLVNTNWYNKRFREIRKERGFNFYPTQNIYS